MESTRVILDMDVGIDDAITIVYLAAVPSAEIVALGSVYGNCDGTAATINALRTLEVCGLTEVPVAPGALRPLQREPRFAHYVHGEDGLGNTRQPHPARAPTTEDAWVQIVRLANEQPGQLDLLAVGPLTNLARAIALDREVLQKCRRVVIMGGSGPEVEPGTILEVDANINNDPEAAQIVFDAAENITMVGVNVTSPTVLAEDDLQRLGESTSERGRFAWDVLQFYLEFYSTYWKRRSCALHDPLAAGVLVDDSYVVAVERGPVEIVSRGHEARAMLRPRHKGPDVTVVTQVDSVRFASDFARLVAEPLDAA